MDREEMQESASPLPVLPRLDRLDRLLQFLEEKHSLSARCCSIQKTEAEDPCRSLSTALEEVHQKGTLMERLEKLENRVFQLNLEVDAENTSGSSSAVLQASEKVGEEAVSTMLTGEHEHLISTLQDKQNPVERLLQESIPVVDQACPISSQNCRNKDKKSKMRRNKWHGWLRMGC